MTSPHGTNVTRPQPYIRQNDGSTLTPAPRKLGAAGREQVLLRDGYYRVHAGPYDSTGEARAASDRIVQALGMRPLLVNR